MADNAKKGNSFAGKVVDLDTGKAVDPAEVKNTYTPQPARVMVVEGNDVRGFVGVDPEYMNYADITGAPVMSEAEEAEYDRKKDEYAKAYEEAMTSDDDEGNEKSDDDKRDQVDSAARTTGGQSPAPSTPPKAPSPSK